MTISKQIQKIDSLILSDYILERCGAMSHLKLQKLLYLVEGYHLAYFGKSLIDDEFEAWVHGPVSRKLYNSLKDKSILHTEVVYSSHEKNKLPSIIILGILILDQIDLINEVLDMYSPESALVLESITHEQLPWINARKGYDLSDKCTVVISKDEMKKYFNTLLN